LTNSLKIGVVLNGPPGCGKDTIANILVESYDKKKLQFKDALYEQTAKHFKIDLDKFVYYASDRSLKDSKSLAGLGGRTPRQALIHVSEDICKPRYGGDFFGKLEAARVEELYGNLDCPIDVIYPDGGFPAEVLCIDSVFDAVLIIRLYRSGFNFEGDSRNYIHLPDTKKRISINCDLVDGEIYKGVDYIMSRIDIFKRDMQCAVASNNQF